MGGLYVIWYSVLIAFAVTIDSFSIGVAYGMKKVSIPLVSVLIINALCVVFFSLALAAGNILAYFLSYTVATYVSAAILIGLGSWLLLQIMINKSTPKQESGLLKKIHIKSLGIAINILKEPASADMDVSGEIDKKEAMFLGSALSLDSMGAGVGASLGIIHALYAVGFLALFNWLFLISGIHIGKFCGELNIKQKIQYIPCCILIGLGLMRLL